MEVDGTPHSRPLRRTRSTLEQLIPRPLSQKAGPKIEKRQRKHSLVASRNGQFLVNVRETISRLLHSEDTNDDGQITIDDLGPMVYSLVTDTSSGCRSQPIAGTYYLANLCQELHKALDFKLTWTVLDAAQVYEDPVARLTRLIKTVFWNNLTRTLDSSLIAIAAPDPKDWTVEKRPRIYVPASDDRQYEYYLTVAMEQPSLKLDVRRIPSVITDEHYREMNDFPGILALDMEEIELPTGKTTLKGVPFIVPGGRFNEMYNWDSALAASGLILSDRSDLAKGVLKNFIYEVQNYGLIPNANRTYYLLRSQPPFLTDLALRVYEATKLEPGAKDLLRRAILAAIKEYNMVWTSRPRKDDVTGLSRYRPGGLGVPLECEPEAFDIILGPFAKKHNMEFVDFVKAYNDGLINEPELDDYFLHDRAVRESGHDVSLRLERYCADLATVDLNCLLYKYERDIALAIRLYFDNRLVVPAEFCTPSQTPGHLLTSSIFDRKAAQRKRAIDRYLWDEERGMYFDYNTRTHERSAYETVTAFFALWCGVASPRQAYRLVTTGLPLFESVGGLTVSTLASRLTRDTGDCHPSHQWDYPYGWAPHQILAWEGLRNYGYVDEAQRLAYKWCLLVTKVFTDFNGAVCEKYDVTQLKNPHRVEAEYGNQGVDFKGYAKEGFGWTNASYLLGMSFVNEHMKRALSVCTDWDTFEKAAHSYDLADPEVLPQGESAAATA